MNPAVLSRREEQLGDSAQMGPRQLSTRTLLAIAFCCLILLFVVYGQSLHFQFILDAHRFTADRRIQESGHIWDYFASFVWAQFHGGPPSFYRPVFLLWMRINFLLSGLSPWGWHLLSITKHALVAALLGVLAWKLLRDSMATLLAATLFALHPAQTESVSWVTVPDPLMSAGMLIALLCYFRCLEPAPVKQHGRAKKSRKAAPTPDKDAKWFALSVLAYFAALLAKETAIVFPAVIFALSLASTRVKATGANRLKTDPGSASRWAQALAQTAPFLLVTGLYLLMRLSAFAGKLAAATQQLPWTTVILSWPSILWFYVKVMFWPGKPHSFADPILVSRFSIGDVLVPLLGLALAAGILAAGLRWILKSAETGLDEQPAARVESALVVGTLLLTLPLLPALNLNALNPGDFLHGRYTYLPLAGVTLLVAAGWRMVKRQRMVLLCAACALAVGLSVLTFEQEKQWNDDASVFAVAHELAPKNVPVARNLADTQVLAGLRLHEEGRCGEAKPIFEQVTRDFPEDWYAWAGLGDCYVELNDLVRGEDSLHRAVELSHDPGLTEHWQELRLRMGLSEHALKK